MSASMAGLWLQTQQPGISPWIWIVLVVIVIILLLWWLGRSEPSETGAPKAEEKPVPLASQPAPQPVLDETRVTEAAIARPTKPDDLVIIEGIGPKIAEVLKDKGIVTFKQLADTQADDLRAILLAANLRLADPATWPEQANLAAEGRWADLQTLQNGLRAGRKIS